MFRRICYPPELNIRIFNPQYPAEQPPLMTPTPNPILRQAKRLRRLPQGRGVLTVVENTACARACSLSKQSGERKAKTSQPKATPWVFVYTSVSPRRGKRMKSSFPFPQPFVWVLILLPFQGVIPAASFPAGRCPGLTYHCPFGALNLNW